VKKNACTAQIAVIAFAVVLAALLSPRPAAAEDFSPQFVDYSGSVDLILQRIDTRRKTQTLTLDTNQYLAIERLKIATDGFVYDPRFMIFFLGGGFGFEQSYYNSYWLWSRANEFYDEYDLTVFLLPEHPYNLELYTRRQIPPMSPMYPKMVVANSRGAIFRYKQNPFTLYLGATWQSIENNDTVETMQYTARGTYTVGPFDNSAGYTRTDTTSFYGGENLYTQYDFSNIFRVDRLSLSSSVQKNEQTQTSILAVVTDSDTFAWSEILSLRLPLNLEANLAHTYQKNDIVQTGLGNYTATTEYRTDGISLTHQLYNSLRTTFSLNKQTLEATGGDSSSRMTLFTIGYDKMIPTGSMHADYSFQDTNATRTGAAYIFNESHVAQVPGGSFMLSNQAVDTTSITLQVKDPVNQSLVTMVPNVDYQVLRFGNQVQILVQNLPASLGPPVPSFGYTFVASYTLLFNESETDITSNGIYVRFKLIEGFFNPYFSYIKTNMDVVSGTFFGGNDVTTTKIFGYSLVRDPFQLLFEYTDFESQVSPYRNLRSSFQYRQAVLEDFDILAMILYNEMKRPAPQQRGFGGDYTDKTTSLMLTAHKRFLPQNLDLYATGSYEVRDTSGTTSDTYALNTNLAWHVGRLDVTLKNSRAYTRSFSTGGTQTYQTDNYFLMVSRKLW
jgi:hypothetical protein